jgi:hypothetical protein
MIIQVKSPEGKTQDMREHVILIMYCPHTRRKSLLGMQCMRMRKISRQVTSCY